MARHQLPFYDQDADETVVLLIGRNAKLHRVHANNIDALDYFVHLFDAALAADVSLGTTVPTYIVFVPAGDATLRGAVTEDFGTALGLDFQLGIVYAVKTVATTAGSTGPTTDLPLTMAYS